MQVKLNLRVIFRNMFGAKSSVMGTRNFLLEYVIGHRLKMYMVMVCTLVLEN